MIALVMTNVEYRVAKGKFTLNNTTYQLPINLDPNTLHGGLKGFDKHMWTLKGKTENSITLELVSKDGDEGFPGTLTVDVTYTVTDIGELKIDYTGVVDEKDTIINLTNHSYFNLNGLTNKDEVLALNHAVSFVPTDYLEQDSTGIPTGKVIAITEDSPMDFAKKDHTIGERIPSKLTAYDNCYVIEKDESKYNIAGGSQVQLIAIVKSPLTGITLAFYTSEPGFQFYSANVVNDTFTTKKTQSQTPLQLASYAAFCLEAQRFPDAINQEKWRKQVILSKGQQYKQSTVYRFYTK